MPGNADSGILVSRDRDIIPKPGGFTESANRITFEQNTGIEASL